MYNSIRTTISYALLGGTGLYYVFKFQGSGDHLLAIFSYQIMVSRALCGIAFHGLKYENNLLKALSEGVDKLQRLFTLPCIAGQLWVNSGCKTIGYLHPFTPIVPMVLIVSDREDDDITNISILLNLISCASVSWYTGNFNGIEAVAAFCLMESVYRDKATEEKDNNDEMYNYCSCMFALFSLNAIAYAYLMCSGCQV